jgi:flagellar basal-body rod protein FlgC
VRAFEPSAPDADRDGLVNRPNLDIARESVERLTSQRQLEASLATIRTADDLLRATIDIKS